MVAADRFSALEKQGEEREVLLATYEDQDLARRVRELLHAHEEIEFADGLRSRRLPVTDPVKLVGLDLGGIRILRVIGQGGMGVVYEAEQVNPHRRIAIKTLSAHVTSPAAAARLEREGAFLARIAHPGVAHVYGVGRSPLLSDLPYIAMEFVQGQSIDIFARERSLPTDARVRLVAEVAETVAHVHTRGLVHRDLKPGNVLVDAAGRTKVLDFGIARVLESEAQTETQHTAKGCILGTLSSMAPEQVSGDSERIDGRADIYAIGVLLHQLLAGRPPLDLADDSLPTAIRRIAEEEPPPLRAFAPGCDADIETIIAKALRKNPDERYPTAEALASDLRHYLAHEPITARRLSAIYRFSKLLRRNRILAASMVCVVFSLATGAFVALKERDRALNAESTERKAKEAAIRAEGEAEAARNRAEIAAGKERMRALSTARLNRMLSNIVAQATPQEHGGRAITAIELVDELERDLAQNEQEDVYVRGRTHLVLADARAKAGRRKEARHHLERARLDLGASPLIGTDDLVDLAILEANLAESSQDVDQAIRVMERLLENDELKSASSERHLKVTLSRLLAETMRDLGRAEELARSVLLISSEMLGARSLGHATDLHVLGYVLSQKGDVPASSGVTSVDKSAAV